MPRFVISPTTSSVVVHARSSLHPFTGSCPVSGHFDVAVASGRPDLRQPPTGQLRVDVSQLCSEDETLDREMRTRLESDRYPYITAVLRDVAAAGVGALRMTGDLTLHGRTRTVHGKGSLAMAGDSLVFEGSMTIDIRDFDIQPPKLLMLRVHPAIDVRLSFTAEPEPVGALVAP